MESEQSLLSGNVKGLDPQLCRILANYHGPKGAKVPLTVSTVSGCVRPTFVEMNPWLTPGYHACYGGNCYLYHARAVPAKKAGPAMVKAHTTPAETLVEAGHIGRAFGMPVRDNQSSDGSMSMALKARDQKDVSVLERNLQILAEAGLPDVPYLCFSAGYCTVSDAELRRLAKYPSLTVHMTVSGWHSKEENSLRLEEFRRYSDGISNVWLRVVNRMDWCEGFDKPSGDEDRCEAWLLAEIASRGWSGRVLRTPFHSIAPFPGGEMGNLGTQFLAGVTYNDDWHEFLRQGALECCQTGKCKTCEARCGIVKLDTKPMSRLVAGRAFAAMLAFELDRQDRKGGSPLGSYVARLLARKAAGCLLEAGSQEEAADMGRMEDRFSAEVERLVVESLERRRLTNDAHALTLDGLDRHRHWGLGRSISPEPSNRPGTRRPVPLP